MAETKDEGSNQVSPILAKVANVLVAGYVLRNGVALGGVELTEQERGVVTRAGDFGNGGSVRELTGSLLENLSQLFENKSLLARIE